MKLLIIGDVHWSTYSSILRSRGKKYSTRLENLIQSVNWAEETAKKQSCDMIVYLGDFFDKSDLTAEEITALKEIKWSSLPHYFIVGNHESNISSLVFSSTNTLNKSNFKIIDAPYCETSYGCEMLFLPYIVEDGRKPIAEYWRQADKGITGLTLTTQEVKYPIIFSHNDIKGIYYGNFESKQGFELKDIETNIGSEGLYINGHIHNGQYVDKNKRIINLGNLTGQNFSEDAFKYEHHVMILDTLEMKTTLIENPYALNFYKLDITDEKGLKQLETLKANSVITVRYNQSYNDKVRAILENNKTIIDSRCLIVHNVDDVVSEDKVELNNVNHLKQFEEFVLNTLGKTDVVISELSEVIK